jgi:hypothetical protein
MFSFWQYLGNFQRDNLFDKHFEKEDGTITLEELLDEDSIINEFRN